MGNPATNLRIQMNIDEKRFEFFAEKAGEEFSSKFIGPAVDANLEGTTVHVAHSSRAAEIQNAKVYAALCTQHNVPREFMTNKNAQVE